MTYGRVALVIAMAAGSLCVPQCVSAAAAIHAVPELTPIRTYLSPAQRSNDRFGISLAWMQDGRIAVGAQDTDVGISNSAGAVHIFDITTANLLKTIPNPFPRGSARFGGEIAVVDRDRLLVGAHGSGATGGSDGVAYVIDTQTGDVATVIPNPRGGHLDEFGFSVDTLPGGQLGIIGAYRDDAGARNAGAAHVVDLATGASLHSLNNPTAAGEDFFGYSVATVGRYTLVSAPRDNTAALNAGAVYVYAFRGSPLLIDTLLNPTPSSEDFFGGTMVAVGDDRVLIGARGHDTGADNAGAAYLFDLVTGQLLQTFFHPEPMAGDRFGTGLTSVAGQFAVIGADGGSGAAYVFRLDSGQLVARIPNPDPVNVSNFGARALEIPGGFLMSGFGNRGGVYFFQIPEPTAGLAAILALAVACVSDTLWRGRNCW